MRAMRTNDYFDMTYNSELDNLIIPEYGRNVQNLIRHARNIESLEERQFFLDQVVHLMMQMHPQNKNLEDYRDKMWKHVFRIAEFDLPGIIPPNGEIPTPESTRKKPEKIEYPRVDRQFRHYGYHVQMLIEKAIAMEDSEIKDGFVEVIGSYMKLAYRTWNKEHYVSDDVIIDDLQSLSKGKLALQEDARLDGLTRANRQKNREREHRDRDDRDNRGRRNNDRRDYRDNRDRDNRGRNDRRDNRGDYRDRDDRGRRGGGMRRDNRGGSNRSGGGRSGGGGYGRRR